MAGPVLHRVYCRILQPDPYNGIYFASGSMLLALHGLSSAALWACSLSLLSEPIVIPAQPNTFLGLNASCQGKLAVHPGFEPGVLTDSAAALLCPILLAIISTRFHHLS